LYETTVRYAGSKVVANVINSQILVAEMRQYHHHRHHNLMTAASGSRAPTEVS